MSEFDFDAALAAKGLGNPAEETQPEETTTEEERPRNEKGQFLPKEQPEEGELILGKFKSQEDLAQAYEHLESLAGRQGQEFGELRRELQEMRQSLQGSSNEDYVPIDDQTASAVDELAESNPQQAAAWALEHQPLLYERVMDIWFQNDPRSAGRFENGLMLRQMRDDITASIGPAVAPLQAQAQERAFAEAWANVAQKYPDMSSHGEAMLEAAKTVPELSHALTTGDAASKERLIENLLFLARGREADRFAAAAAETGRGQATDAIAEKIAAAVATGSHAQASGEKTPIEAWKDNFLAEPSTSIWSGLERKGQ